MTTAPPSVETATLSVSGYSVAAAPFGRHASIDIVRGIAMASIIGVDQLAWALRGLLSSDRSPAGRLAPAVAAQFEHAEWEGLRFYDLVLPLLIFLTGVSIVFSLAKAEVAGHRLDSPYWRIGRRAALLYGLG